MRVTVDVDFVELEGDYGPVDGVEVECPICGASGSAFGQHESSVTRAIMTMREECSGESGPHYYVPNLAT